MRICESCGQEFDSFQAKANHVRWKHKPQAYSEDGLRKIRESAIRTNNKRFGQKTFVTEHRTCTCGQIFIVTFSPERAYKGKKFCSRKCANSRKQNSEINSKRRNTLKNTLDAKPELISIYISNLIKSDHSRSSSKAERALAEALKPYGFNRHLLVRTENFRFDVDIVSSDKKIWIESDGSWHFRKIHEGHDFEATKFRDTFEEQEAINRQILLIRVNNEASSIDEQVNFVLQEIESWDRVTGKVVKFRYS